MVCTRCCRGNDEDSDSDTDSLYDEDKGEKSGCCGCAFATKKFPSCSLLLVIIAILANGATLGGTILLSQSTEVLALQLRQTSYVVSEAVNLTRKATSDAHINLLRFKSVGQLLMDQATESVTKSAASLMQVEEDIASAASAPSKEPERGQEDQTDVDAEQDRQWNRDSEEVGARRILLKELETEKTSVSLHCQADRLLRAFSSRQHLFDESSAPLSLLPSMASLPPDLRPKATKKLSKVSGNSLAGVQKLVSAALMWLREEERKVAQLVSRAVELRPLLRMLQDTVDTGLKAAASVWRFVAKVVHNVGHARRVFGGLGGGGRADEQESKVSPEASGTLFRVLATAKSGKDSGSTAASTSSRSAGRKTKKLDPLLLSYSAIRDLLLGAVVAGEAPGNTAASHTQFAKHFASLRRQESSSLLQKQRIARHSRKRQREQNPFLAAVAGSTTTVLSRYFGSGLDDPDQSAWESDAAGRTSTAWNWKGTGDAAAADFGYFGGGDGSLSGRKTRAAVRSVWNSHSPICAGAFSSMYASSAAYVQHAMRRMAAAAAIRELAQPLVSEQPGKAAPDTTSDATWNSRLETLTAIADAFAATSAGGDQAKMGSWLFTVLLDPKSTIATAEEGTQRRLLVARGRRQGILRPSTGSTQLGRQASKTAGFCGLTWEQAAFGSEEGSFGEASGEWERQLFEEAAVVEVLGRFRKLECERGLALALQAIQLATATPTNATLRRLASAAEVRTQAACQATSVIGGSIGQGVGVDAAYFHTLFDAPLDLEDAFKKPVPNSKADDYAVVLRLGAKIAAARAASHLAHKHVDLQQEQLTGKLLSDAKQLDDDSLERAVLRGLEGLQELKIGQRVGRVAVVYDSMLHALVDSHKAALLFFEALGGFTSNLNGASASTVAAEPPINPPSSSGEQFNPPVATGSEQQSAMSFAQFGERLHEDTTGGARQPMFASASANLRRMGGLGVFLESHSEGREGWVPTSEDSTLLNGLGLSPDAISKEKTTASNDPSIVKPALQLQQSLACAHMILGSWQCSLGGHGATVAASSFLEEDEVLQSVSLPIGKTLSEEGSGSNEALIDNVLRDVPVHTIVKKLLPVAVDLLKSLLSSNLEPSKLAALQQAVLKSIRVADSILLPLEASQVVLLRVSNRVQVLGEKAAVLAETAGPYTLLGGFFIFFLTSLSALITWTFISITSMRRWAQDQPSGCCSVCCVPFIGCCFVSRKPVSRGSGYRQRQWGNRDSAGTCCWCCCTSRRTEGANAIAIDPLPSSCCGGGCEWCRSIRRCYLCTFCCVDMSLCGAALIMVLMVTIAVGFSAIWGACVTVDDIGSDTCELLQAFNASVEKMEGESMHAQTLRLCSRIEAFECNNMEIPLFVALVLGGGVVSYVAQYHLLVSLQYHYDKAKNGEDSDQARVLASQFEPELADGNEYDPSYLVNY